MIATVRLVSIVVINYNYHRFLERAVQSALDQDYPNIEVLLFDDGSTDKSSETFDRFRNEITVVESPHIGLVPAFNAAFTHTNGDYVIFLDADDFLDPQCVSTVMEGWHPGLSKIQFRLRTVDAYGNDQLMPFPYFPTDFNEASALTQSLRHGAYPWTVRSGNCYSTEFLRKILPIDTDRIFKAPDGYVNKLAPLFGGVKSLNLVLGSYRVHGNNIWAQSSGSFNLKPIQDNVKLDIEMHSIFSDTAATRGYKIGRFDDICLPNQLEIRLLSLRLGPDSYPIKSDTLKYLRQVGRRAAREAPNISPLGEFAWNIWFFVICFFPEKTIKLIYKTSRGQSKRHFLIRQSIRIVRGTARQGIINDAL